MAIQSNFPAIRPSLLLDFANSKRLDPRITFTRASTARYYDGSTVAKAEENLFVRSQEFATVAGGWRGQYGRAHLLQRPRLVGRAGGLEIW